MNQIGIRCIRDQVLVRQDPKKTTLPSGLYVPERCSRELQEDFGVVLDVGPDITEDGPRVGDRVLFRRKPSSALTPDEREGGRPEWDGVVVLREEHIVGVVESD